MVEDKGIGERGKNLEVMGPDCYVLALGFMISELRRL